MVGQNPTKTATPEKNHGGDIKVKEEKKDFKEGDADRQGGPPQKFEKRNDRASASGRGGRGGQTHGGRGGRQHGGQRNFGGRGGGEQGGGRFGGDRRNQDDQMNRMEESHGDGNGGMGGPITYPPSEKPKFTGRCRLFVGNLTSDTTEEEFKTMFTQYGELSEVFLNASRGFGFVRLDTRQNAESAKNGLDGTQHKGRTLRVRFATHGAALKVKYLSQYVSNEQLESAFSQFGVVERAVVIVDDRGRSTGEGIVEFARKPGASAALNKINEGVFIMGANPKPILVEPLEQTDDEDGMPEKYLQRSQQLNKEREQGPRFAAPGSFEFEFGQRWKQMFEMERQQLEQLKRQFEEATEKLELDQESALIEHETMMMRQDLMRRQEELRRMEEQRTAELSRRQEMMRSGGSNSQMNPFSSLFNKRPLDDRRPREEDLRRQQEEALRNRNMGGMGNMGRNMDERNMRGGGRDDHNLMQQQEAAIREMQGGPRGNPPPMAPPPAPPASMGLDRPRNQMAGGGPMGGNNEMGSGGDSGNQNNMGAGGVGNNNNQGQQQMRQSRFDQPPQAMGGSGFGGNMGGMGGGNMMGGSNMGGGMRNDRGMMDRRGDRSREDFFDNKRQRRY